MPAMRDARARTYFAHGQWRVGAGCACIFGRILAPVRSSLIRGNVLRGVTGRACPEPAYCGLLRLIRAAMCDLNRLAAAFCGLLRYLHP